MPKRFVRPLLAATVMVAAAPFAPSPASATPDSVASPAVQMVDAAYQKASVDYRERTVRSIVENNPEVQAAADRGVASRQKAEAERQAVERQIAGLEQEAADLEQQEGSGPVPVGTRQISPSPEIIADAVPTGSAGTVTLSADAGTPTTPQSTGCTLPPGQGLPAEGPWPATLAPVHVAQAAQAAGFAGQDLTVAVAVAYAESSHRPGLTHQNTDSHRSIDYGLWQINGYYHPEQMATGDWSNPWDNAEMAYSIWSTPGRYGSWSSWVTWKKGAHEKYMGMAETAVGQLAELEAATGTCG